MPKSKKFSKENLPLEIQAQLHKKTWVKEAHDKAVQVHHDNIDRVRKLEAQIESKLRTLSAIGDSIDLLKTTADRWQYDEFSKSQKQILARVNHLPVEDIEVCDPAECQMYRYTDGASILVDNKPNSFDWLREHGYDDIIKNTFTCSFGRGVDVQAAAFKAVAEKEGYAPEQKTDIHSQTLRAFVRERVENGDEFPMELFGAYVGQRAIIKRGK